jgi:hypothetical protein
MDQVVNFEEIRELKIAEDSFLKKLKWFALLGSAACFFLGLVLSLSSLKECLYSFHFCFCLLVTLFSGALFFVLVQHATSSAWSVVLRRIPEVIVSQIYVLPLFSIPTLLFSEKIFKWIKLPVGVDALVDMKRGYLNFPFLIVRVIFYFAVLISLGCIYSKKSFQQDQSRDLAISSFLKTLSYPGLFLFALTITFFGFDFIKSLDPHWYSTMFGVYLFAGSFIGATSLTILIIELVLSFGVQTEYVNDEHRHDLGKFLFGFNVFWTYVSFSQFFLIWYANIPEGTLFFFHRLDSGWAPVTYFLIFGHFILPFFYLLPRTIKRSRKTLAVGALWMLGIHVLDIFWMIMPNYRHEFRISFTDVFFVLGSLSFLLFLILRKLFKVPLVPCGDPRFEESLSYDHPL